VTTEKLYIGISIIYLSSSLLWAALLGVCLVGWGKWRPPLWSSRGLS